MLFCFHSISANSASDVLGQCALQITFYLLIYLHHP